MLPGEILCDETGGHFVGGVGRFKNSTGPVLCGSRLPFLLEPPVATEGLASKLSSQESVAARRGS